MDAVIDWRICKMIIARSLRNHALDWFMAQRNNLLDLDKFKEPIALGLSNRGSKEERAIRLIRLRQTGNVQDYISEWERLKSTSGNLFEAGHLIYCSRHVQGMGLC